MPSEFDDIVIGTNDALRRQLRYKTDGSTAWTTVDLTAATEVYLYLITAAGAIAKTFLLKTTHAALCPEAGATGYLTFEAEDDTFVAADIGTYILRFRVVNAQWPDGKTFQSSTGVRITT